MRVERERVKHTNSQIVKKEKNQQNVWNENKQINDWTQIYVFTPLNLLRNNISWFKRNKTKNNPKKIP